ncbi:hypothetical protein I6F36_06440 [Bradyrhizobium sp. BRP19]|uniref:hypothetical protein n=1 Tax=Bradyrhizobium sp. BRP19 TaxID=2793823 RepID=UPI001CD435AC|nr:hypothetical protein [Bradyrhizobium sp. BRP19]MCA1546443.1 hypothetical protein [Bradyrhizobium sp. BRP19]
MADAIENAIDAYFESRLGEDFAQVELRGDPLFLKALAVAPDQDEDAVELIRRYFELETENFEFGNSVLELMSEHADDESFMAQCRRALKSNADRTSAQQRDLLHAWEPTLRHVCLDN